MPEARSTAHRSSVARATPLAFNVTLPVQTYDLLRGVKADGESDSDAIARALSLLSLQRLLKEARDPNRKEMVRMSWLEFQKAGFLLRNLRAVGYTDEFSVTVVRALYGDQSDKDISAAFSLFDRKCVGSIDAAELRQFLQLLGEELPKEKMDELFSLVDQDRSGKLELQEFSLMLKAINPKSAEGSLLDKFHTTQLGGAVGHAWNAGLSVGNSAVAAGINVGTKVIGTGFHLMGLQLPSVSPDEDIVRKAKDAGFNDQAARTLIAALGEQKEEDLRLAFRLFDHQARGVIDKAHFRTFCQIIFEEMSPAKLDEAFAGVDQNRDGTLDFDEFRELLRALRPEDDDVLEPETTCFGTVRSWFA